MNSHTITAHCSDMRRVEGAIHTKNNNGAGLGHFKQVNILAILVFQNNIRERITNFKSLDLRGDSGLCSGFGSIVRDGVGGGLSLLCGRRGLGRGRVLSLALGHAGRSSGNKSSVCHGMSRVEECN